jgi:hypothetical protein
MRVGWNPKAGQGDSRQRKLGRMFRSRAMMAWSELLRDAVCAKLELFDSDEKVRPLYRQLSAGEQEQIKRIIERLVGWKFWDSPEGEIDRVLADNASIVKNWMRDYSLTTGYLMGAPE